MNKTILVYGGSFDPVHRGHQAMINNLAKSNLGDQLWVVPCATRADKAFLLTDEERLQILEETVRDVPNVRVMRTQIDRKAMIPTYELMQLYKKEHSNYDFWFVIGADLVPTLKDWKHAEKLKEEVQFIISNRGGYQKNKQDFPKHYKQITIEDVNQSSSEIRKLVRDHIPRLEKIKLLEKMVCKSAIQVLDRKQLL